MTTAERHTWSELYLMQDLYSAWIRVLLRWLYLEGMSCCPTATVEFESEAKAAEAAADWTRLSEGSWAVQSVERSAVAIHNEAFEAEETRYQEHDVATRHGASLARGEVGHAPCLLCASLAYPCLQAAPRVEWSCRRAG